MKIILFFFFTVTSVIGWGQISLTSIGSPYNQDFNTLASSGTSTFLPAGWKIAELPVNLTYTAGTGSSTTGDSYSFGAAAASDRALGGLLSGSVTPTFGSSYTNNTGSTITSILFTYTGEQWRLGSIGRVDRLDFQYSFNATSLTTGTWTDGNALDFTAPITTGALGALNGNLAVNKSIISFTITGLTITASSEFWIRWSDFNATGSDDGLGIDDFTLTPFSSISNSITTGAITGAPFTVDCATSDNGSVDFSSTGTFAVGNTFTAELSNASGSFASPIAIGTLTGASAEGADPSGTINFDIPGGTATGAGYLIRVISSDPVITGSSSSTFNINLTGGPCVLEPPHLTSVIINSCDGFCSEGDNELVFGTSGDYSFDVNTSNFDFLYGSVFPGENYTDVLVNNSTRINELNTAAGCGSLFVDATGGNIPAHANWLLASTNICEEALTWNGLCGLGPIYVIFQNDASWMSGGNFVNNPSGIGTRYYRTSITTTSGPTFTIDYTTIGTYPNSDGVFASFDFDGGPATSYGDNNCVLEPVLLPAGLVYFKANYFNNQTFLSWKTSSEQNNDYFTLFHSTDGNNFHHIGTIQGAGNSSSSLNYSFEHNRPPRGINYYKLVSTDYDGTNYNKGIISVLVEGKGSYFDPLTNTLKFGESSEYTIYSMEGKLIDSIINDNSMPFEKKGLYIIYNQRTGTTERLFIP